MASTSEHSLRRYSKARAHVEGYAKLDQCQHSANELSAHMKLPLPKFLQRTTGCRGPVDSVTDATLRRWFQRGVAAYEKRQYFKALAAWKQASAQGNAEAHFRIGQLYARGEGVVQSIPDAVVWYKRAAEAWPRRSAISARHDLSEWRKAGTQRTRQLVQIGLAARQRGRATRNLHALFPNGIAVEKDLEAALRWMGAAASAGKAEAQTIVG